MVLIVANAVVTATIFIFCLLLPYHQLQTLFFVLIPEIAVFTGHLEKNEVKQSSFSLTPKVMFIPFRNSALKMESSDNHNQDKYRKKFTWEEDSII